MTSISNDDFIKFLKHYETDPKYYNTIEQLSWPKDDNGVNIPNRDPLIPNDWFKMLSLDDMCKGCSKFDTYNRPSTTDALWYNLKEDGGLVLYFVEFKWHNLNRKKNQYSCSDEDAIFKLRLKPFESIFIVLPKLFEDYCETYEKDFTDLNDFLKQCEIKVYSFVKSFDRKDGGLTSKRNKYKIRLKNIRIVGPKGSVGNTVHKQYKRLELTSLIDFADVFSKYCFEDFLKIEELI